jgi:hypothetical protein
VGKGKRKKGPKYQKAHRNKYAKAKPGDADWEHHRRRSRNYYGDNPGARR